MESSRRLLPHHWESSKASSSIYTTDPKVPGPYVLSHRRGQGGGESFRWYKSCWLWSVSYLLGDSGQVTSFFFILDSEVIGYVFSLGCPILRAGEETEETLLSPMDQVPSFSGCRGVRTLVWGSDIGCTICLGHSIHPSAMAEGSPGYV